MWKSKIGLLEQICGQNPYDAFFLGHPVEYPKGFELGTTPVAVAWFHHNISNTLRRMCSLAIMIYPLSAQSRSAVNTSIKMLCCRFDFLSQQILYANDIVSLVAKCDGK